MARIDRTTRFAQVARRSKRKQPDPGWAEYIEPDVGAALACPMGTSSEKASRQDVAPT